MSKLVYISKQKLEKLYLEEQKSMRQISKEMGCSNEHIRQQIIKYNIPKRSTSESALIARKRDFTIFNPFIWEKNQLEIFDGLVLSDGHISTNKYAARYSQTCKHEEFLIHIKNKIIPLKTIIRKRKDRDQEYSLETLSSSTLFEQRQRWYIDSTKILPKDFKLTPISLLYWFLGDGRYGEYKTTRALALYPYSLSNKETENLREQITNLGIKSTIIKSQYGTYIKIKTSNIDVFFTVIGKSPVECYKYKWGRFKNIDQIIKWRNAL